jgi:hypothetical protein
MIGWLPELFAERGLLRSIFSMDVPHTAGETALGEGLPSGYELDVSSDDHSELIRRLHYCGYIDELPEGFGDVRAPDGSLWALMERNTNDQAVRWIGTPLRLHTAASG